MTILQQVKNKLQKQLTKVVTVHQNWPEAIAQLRLFQAYRSHQLWNEDLYSALTHSTCSGSSPCTQGLEAPLSPGGSRDIKQAGCQHPHADAAVTTQKSSRIPGERIYPRQQKACFHQQVPKLVLAEPQ